ncbi:MAG: GNAT family N-acetyltransferase, partial [Oscillospiraceae bacterium]|nr:GNAT family N-acetyltransferase [Oscillospiraceae bacterium]
MIKECMWIPTLETERLFLRELTADDADDLRKWLGLDIVYKYWGRPAGKGEKNPELLFIDPRPHVKRKPSHDFIWGIVNKETGKVIGMIEVFDV